MFKTKIFFSILILAGLWIITAPLARAAVLPNDPLFPQQWYLRQAKFPEAWELTTGSPDVIIAVLDSGIDEDHPDLIFKLWTNAKEKPNDGLDNDGNGYVDDIHGWDFLENEPSPNPKTRQTAPPLNEAIHHGTVVSGIAAAKTNNGEGVAGASWLSPIMHLRVLDEFGSGREDHLVQAIDYAVNNSAQIINFSFVGNEESVELLAAIKRAYQAGVIVVAAAGNERERKNGVDLANEPRYPVCDDGPAGENFVIGVAALDQENKKLEFSNYGAVCVDLAAPGARFMAPTVYSPKYDLNNYYLDRWSGTSMAAPLVAGGAALVKAINPKLTPNEVRHVLTTTTDPIDDVNPLYLGKLGRGLLNIFAAVKLAASLAAEAGAPPVPVTNSLFSQPSGADSGLTIFSPPPTTQPPADARPLLFGIAPGSLIKASGPAVYYYGHDAKRYVFPNESTFKTWYADFATVQTVADAALGQIPIGGNVTYRPGVKLIKITTDPKVYAVDRGGVLRWVNTESLAELIFSAEWRQLVEVVPDVFFVNYRLGELIQSAVDYSPVAAQESSPDISADKGLSS